MQKNTIFMLGAVLLSVAAFAQPGNPSTPAPLGAVEALAAAGLVYGGYKARRNAKKGKKL
ncbi:MAG: hypothetical protein HWE14_07310 [Flavobacteriia bacterium]|nr:hypothetical protein [Flavobacteriia bacterium]